jgi:oligoribonuclease NrnB/cAMP/cGMP phosphodiesterase (DHH superfamily)
LPQASYFITFCIAGIGAKLQNPIIFYHYPCPDGTAAALAAFLKFGDAAEYRPINYGQGFEAPGLKDRDVYFLDFAPTRDEIFSLVGVCKTVTILDHHKTAEKNLEFLSFPNLQIVFDQTKSGAMLSHEFFNPETAAMQNNKYFAGCRQYSFFETIQDRDLWKFEGPNTRAVGAYLQSQPLTIEVFKEVYENWNCVDIDYVTLGLACLDMESRLVERMAARPSILMVAGYPVIAANAPVLHSEVGHYLNEKYPYSPFACTWLFDGLKVYLSLRSRKDGPDVSEIAKKVNPNAGGHKNAAGAEITPQRLAVMIAEGFNSGFDVSVSPAV